MELLNATRMQAGYTLGMDPDGREHVVVAVKGTFAIPVNGDDPQLDDEQVPLVEADTFTGAPGFSATIHESDYALHKPKCDVLLNGSAYAPIGQRAERVRVTLQVGTMQKSFDVVGDRVWEAGLRSVKAGAPIPFSTMPISYDRAFGGIDDTDPEKVDAFRDNPVGVGFHTKRNPSDIEGTPVPNTEEMGRPITRTNGRYRPMAFGPIGRAWPPRPEYAGTYDDDWLENHFPFLPKDFDPRYYQAAPPDQQIDFPTGGEPVTLVNLTLEGTTQFRLPTLEVPVEFTDARFDRSEHRARLDTIVIEPDEGRFTLAWRASHPLKRNMLEMRQIVVGRMPRGWYRARALGKTYYPSLRDLSRSS